MPADNGEIKYGKAGDKRCLMGKPVSAIIAINAWTFVRWVPGQTRRIAPIAGIAKGYVRVGQLFLGERNDFVDTGNRAS
jgi:hypothetical protein